MMRLRRWLAEKLCPGAFRDAERFFWMRSNAGDLRDWCGREFPQIGEAATWLLKSDSVRSMPLADYHEAVAAKKFQSVMVDGISGFRESLRRSVKAKAA